jgi:polyphosphate kinase
VILKLNAIVDVACVEALYRASEAGVEIELIIRAACSLLPGIDGLSEHVVVRSIIGEFLEHSRIWRFENGGEPEWYIGSADLMDRNLDRRIEAVVPIEDADAQRRLDEILTVMAADDRRSWQLGPDARWRRTEALSGVPGSVDTHALLRERATAMAQAALTPRRPRSGAGSMEPWA